MSILARPIESEAVLLPPEIAFLLAEGLSPGVLRHAAEIARTSGTDAATALLHTGSITEDAYYRALARRLGTTFLEDVPLGQDARYPQILEVGAAPLAPGSPHALVAAPRGRVIARLLENGTGHPARFAITTPTRLRLAAFARHADAIATAASDDLHRRHPEFSCRPGPQPADLALLGGVIALGLVVANLPGSFGLAVLALFQVVTLAMLTVRLAAVTIGAEIEAPPQHRELRDDELPHYTVIVALYREAKVVPRLVYSLAKLDYPAAKLQVMFVIEADDAETAAAFRAAPMPARFEVVVAPPGLPKTKPRALNVALTLARGDLLVVYDAEDVVDPRQLRTSAGIFARSPATLAGIQGRLVIDNAKDGLLTRGIMAQTPQAQHPVRPHI